VDWANVPATPEQRPVLLACGVQPPVILWQERQLKHAIISTIIVTELLMRVLMQTVTERLTALIPVRMMHLMTRTVTGYAVTLMHVKDMTTA
jgi:hypothetical protein